MLVIPGEDAVLPALVDWGKTRDEVRAVVITSSRARGDGAVDLLSDYDVILGVAQSERFAADLSWMEEFGEPMVRWGDQSERLDFPTFFRGVIYRNGVKCDFSLWPVELFAACGEDELPDQLDVGYRVLLDKDGLTRRWKPASLRAHIPAVPSQEEYDALVQEWWWSSTYVAKSLWRGEIVFAKYVLDFDMRLLTFGRLLDWRIELDHEWSLKPGLRGRGYERLLPAEIRLEYAATYVGADPDEIWMAFERLSSLFRRVATEVGSALGFSYPTAMDQEVTGYLRDIRALPAPEQPPSGSV